MKKYFHILGILGLLLAIYGVILAVFYSIVPWYIYFSVGGTFFLAWINLILKNDSLFGKNKNYILKTYLLYLFFTILIEIIGRGILNIWTYPFFNFTENVIHVFLIGYAFPFFFIHESFKLIKIKVGLLPLAMILTTLINAFVHEIPNTFAHEWVYNIPYFTLEILQINVIVIVGWIILISVPLITKRILK
jgi:hypothetical protein